MSQNDPVTITHKSGSSVTIYPYGAHITSFKTASGRELLFVSSSAKLDGSKAIRGGIPLVFPQFGQPDKSYPQHGFLRRNYWKAGLKEEGGDSSSCEFYLDLKDVETARGDGQWGKETKYDCRITLTVKILAEELTTIMKFDNTGAVPFDFQTLFHTYLKVAGGKALDPTSCNVSGLEGYKAEDKITGEEYVLGESPIIIDREVDRIYQNSSKPILSVVVNTGGQKVSLKAKASVDGKETPVSVVVWNPHIEKAKGMSDFTDEQYHDMVCVEPGVLYDVPSIENGKSAVFEQVITAL